MKSKLFIPPFLLFTFAFGAFVIPTFSAEKTEEAEDPDKFVICLHDGMVMKTRAMKERTIYKEHKHFICGYGTDEKKRFDANPEKYVKDLELDGLEAFVHFQTLAEYQDVFKGMNMGGMLKMMIQNLEQTPSATHFLIVNLRDKKTQQIKNAKETKVQIELIDPKGRKQKHALNYADMVKSHSALYDLSASGKYQVNISFQAGEKQYETKFEYVLKSPKKEDIKKSPNRRERRSY